MRVPVTNVIGSVGEGWRVLTSMLAHERVALGAGTAGRQWDKDAFHDLCNLARHNHVDEDAAIRSALVEVYMQQRLLDYTGVRIREALDRGDPVGPVGSVVKLGTAQGGTYCR